MLSFHYSRAIVTHPIKAHSKETAATKFISLLHFFIQPSTLKLEVMSTFFSFSLLVILLLFVGTVILIIAREPENYISLFY